MFGVFQNKTNNWKLVATYQTLNAAEQEAKYLRNELQLDVKVFQKKS